MFPFVCDSNTTSDGETNRENETEGKYWESRAILLFTETDIRRKIYFVDGYSFQAEAGISFHRGKSYAELSTAEEPANVILKSVTPFLSGYCALEHVFKRTRVNVLENFPMRPLDVLSSTFLSLLSFSPVGELHCLQLYLLFSITITDRARRRRWMRVRCEERINSLPHKQHILQC